MITKEIRSYEVSLWTLQDEFITVLKWSDVEQKGRIQEPQMELNIDGTEKFTFKIPMYLESFANGKRTVIENPNWYNTKNGNLMEGMRKIKVIFNKDTTVKKCFEFLITKITEEHQEDQLFCNIECEGLAFHELGKIGYKINLSLDNFLLDHESWEKKGYWIKEDGTQVNTEPKQNVNYWCEQCGLALADANTPINPKKWYYKINMDWSAFQGLSRSSNTIYEEEYTTEWYNNLNPKTRIASREKLRPISIDQSNIYNITQTIAETFNIHCKYEYQHDANNHITSRTVIFYNNFMAEENGCISLTYPYTSKSVSREIDSSEITTQLYVQSQDDDSTLNGIITIADSPANNTKEDYLLNFDYMYKCGAITQEQYDEVKEYEKFMYTQNTALQEKALLLSDYNAQKIDLEANIQILDKSVEVAQEQIDDYSALYNKIDSSDGDADGYFQRKADSNYRALAMTDKLSGLYYIDFNEQDKGILESSLAIYKTYSASATTEQTKLTNQINNVTYTYDKYGDIIRAYFPANTFGASESHMVYAIYKYSPKLYYEEIINDWKEKHDADAAELADLQNDLNDLNDSISAAETEYDTLLADKKKHIREFKEMLGPALREGYWSPEEYADYGEQRSVNASFPSSYNESAILADAGEGIIVNWDNTLFKGEQDIYYEEGVTLEKHYYPCIDISGAGGSNINFANIKTMMNSATGKLSFVFNNNYFKSLDNNEVNKLQNLSNFTLGGKMHLGFIQINNTIKPVLILDGAKSMTDDEIKFMLSTGTGKGNPKLCVFSTSISNGEITVTTLPSYSVPLNKIYWVPSLLSGVNDISGVTVIYPRIKFSDMRLKINSGYLSIAYNNANNLLTSYEDYSMLSRVTAGRPEYFLTIKPEVFIDAGTYTGAIYAKYILSNAATSIYLDAQEILKENSEPKVSYNVEINVLNEEYLKILYSMLAQLVIINDVELKFENMYGYISQIQMKLDAPWEDTIEVKNYKTKFEDLFSTIVAQTEEMKRNNNAFMLAANGGIPMQSEALESTLSTNQIILNNYFDTYFSESATVEDKLKSLFTEAGELLANTQGSLNKISELSKENQAILDAFATKVNTELTAQVFNSKTRPTTFKVGDIWNEINSNYEIIARYVATSSSEDANGGGWTKVYDGSLAAITGASLDIDAVAGTVDIKAANNINIASGNEIDIAANANVNIHGNEAVNIGGTTINIGSTSTTTSDCGGINIVATAYNADTFEGANVSKVLIHPEEIKMAGSKITMYTGTADNSATGIILDGSTGQNAPDYGIWLGSSKGIKLFSSNNSGSTANVEINPTHIIYGMNNNNTSNSVVEMTDSYIIMGVGTSFDNIKSSGITISNNISGLQITKDKIGLAVNNNGSRSAIIMGGEGLMIGATNNNNSPQTNGTYVSISGAGLTIGSSGKLSIDTTLFKIDSSATATNPKLYIADNATWNNATNGIQYSNTNGLQIKGAITANSFTIAGITPFDSQGHIDAELVDNIPEGLTTSDLKKVTVTSTGLSWGDTLNSGEAGLIVGSQGSMQIAANGNLTIANNGNFTIQSGGIVSVTSSNLIINTNAGNGASIFKLTDGAANDPVNFLNLAKDSSGNLFAQIAGWRLEQHKLFSGTSTNYVALDSGTTNEDCAIWAGDDESSDAPFRVNRNGSVYLNSLMVLDTRTRTSTDSAWGAWQIDNNKTHEDITTSADNLTQTGYVSIDFSKLNFNSAVSLNLAWGSSDNVLEVDAIASLWGRFSTTRKAQGSISINAIDCTEVTDANTGQFRVIVSTPAGYMTLTGGGSIANAYRAGKNDIDISWNSASFTAGGVYASVTVNGHTYTHFYSE